MQSPTTFTYLRSKLSEWKAKDVLLPPADLSWERFQKVATSEILPVLCEAKDALESAGLDVSITDLDEETRCLGLSVNDVGLFFTPSDDALTIHFMTRRFTAEEQGYERRVLYTRVKAEPLRRLVEEALLRLLGPWRANAVHQEMQNVVARLSSRPSRHCRAFSYAKRHAPEEWRITMVNDSEAVLTLRMAVREGQDSGVLPSESDAGRRLSGDGQRKRGPCFKRPRQCPLS